jgi:hypothetical protein
MYPRDDSLGAHTALDAVVQLSHSDDELINYALSADVLWALPGFLARRGLLDDDWRRRLADLRREGG